jgi:hypothetical protein
MMIAFLPSQTRWTKEINLIEIPEPLRTGVLFHCNSHGCQFCPHRFPFGIGREVCRIENGQFVSFFLTNLLQFHTVGISVFFAILQHSVSNVISSVGALVGFNNGDQHDWRHYNGGPLNPK